VVNFCSRFNLCEVSPSQIFFKENGTDASGTNQTQKQNHSVIWALGTKDFTDDAENSSA